MEQGQGAKLVMLVTWTRTVVLYSGCISKPDLIEFVYGVDVRDD